MRVESVDDNRNSVVVAEPEREERANQTGIMIGGAVLIGRRGSAPVFNGILLDQELPASTRKRAFQDSFALVVMPATPSVAATKMQEVVL